MNCLFPWFGRLIKRPVFGISVCVWVLVLYTALASSPVYVFGSDLTIRDLFQKVTGSVVVVRTLERMIVDGKMPTEQHISDLGSGVLISGKGHVVTAAHLVQAADRVQVQFKGGGSVEASIIASEPGADIALLLLKNLPEDAVVAPFGDSDQVAIGDRIIVLGAPFGLEHSLSVGYISGRHDTSTLVSPLQLGEFFQTDASINRGNSGGPMFNEQGEVIGIVSYIISRSGIFEGVGFAVTSNTIRDLLLKRTGFWSGVTVFALSRIQARALNLPRDYGVLVLRVADGSIAQQLGLRPGFLPSRIGDREVVLGGDVILTLDGIPVGLSEDSQRLRDHLVELSVGQDVTLEIFRRGDILKQTWQVTKDWLHRYSDVASQ